MYSWGVYDVHKMHACLMCERCSQKTSCRVVHVWCAYDFHKMHAFVMCVRCSQYACMPDVYMMFTKRCMHAWCVYDVYKWCAYDVHKKAEHGIPDFISFMRARNPVLWPKMGIRNRGFRALQKSIMSCIRDRACLMCVWCSQKDACLTCVRCKHHVVYTGPFMSDVCVWCSPVWRPKIARFQAPLLKEGYANTWVLKSG